MAGNGEVATEVCLPGFESWLHHLPAPICLASVSSFLQWSFNDSNHVDTQHRA